MTINPRDLLSVADGEPMAPELAAALAAAPDRDLYDMAYRMEVVALWPAATETAKVLTGLLRHLALEEMARRGQIVLIDDRGAAHA